MSKKFIILFFLVFLFLCTSGQGLGRTSPVKKFNQGWQEFHRLLKTPSQAKYRSYWMRIKKYFQTAYNLSPNGPYAPKSLYYLGRTYQELGKRSYLKKDFQKAVHYFQKVVQEFPSHSWSDDAKLYQAKIRYHNLNNPEQAYLDLLSIIHNYPKGDKKTEAKDFLSKLDRKFLQEIGIESPQPSQQSPSKGKKEKTSNIRSMKSLMDIRHWSSDKYTRVVLDLNDETEYKYFHLNPNTHQDKSHRLVVDLYKTAISHQVQKKLKIQDGLLSRIRAAQNNKNKARVVLDVQKLGKVNVFSLPDPFRVVLDVYAPEKQTAALSLKEKSKLIMNKKSKELSDTLVEQLGLGIKTVMIDPGHGGKDPGAVCHGVMEKDVNLRMAKILGQILEEKGLKVLYTRTRDKFIPLEERTALANSQKADLFISLHANAHKRHSIHGFEIYYLNLAKSKDAVRVAARENSVSTKKISDLQLILTDLMLNSKIKESRNLANIVLKNTLSYGKKFYKLNDNGVRQAPFYVLMGAKMPSILVEVGYITNSYDRRNLQSYAFLKRVAWGIYLGIADYRERIQNFAAVN